MSEHYILLVSRANKQKEDAVELQQTDRRGAAELFYLASKNYQAAIKQKKDPRWEYLAGFCINRAKDLLTAPRAKIGVSGHVSGSGTADEGWDEDTEKLLMQIRSCLHAPPKKTFKDVAGLDYAKKKVDDNIMDLLRKKKAAAELGLDASYGIVLYGPPGTGKTHFAEAAAGELAAPIYEISAAEIVGKWVGDPEKLIKLLFKEANEQAKEHGLAVIFLDDCESLVRARDGDAKSYEARWAGQFLTEMDGLRSLENILIMATTNRPWALDDTIVRPGRFNELIYVGLPDEEARAYLFELGLKKVFPDGLDFVKLASMTEGYSCADIAGRGGICEVARRGLLNDWDAGNKRPITMADVVTAIGSIKKSVTSEQLGKIRAFAKGRGENTNVEDSVLNGGPKLPVLQPVTEKAPKKPKKKR